MPQMPINATDHYTLLHAPGNLLLAARNTNLEDDSVANVSQILAIDKAILTDYCPVGMLFQPPAPGPNHFVSQPVGFASGRSTSTA
jgi:hypothetical protein